MNTWTITSTKFRSCTKKEDNRKKKKEKEYRKKKYCYISHTRSQHDLKLQNQALFKTKLITWKNT